MCGECVIQLCDETQFERRVYTIERENKFLYEMHKIYWCENDGEKKCTQNLQNVVGDQGWDDLLYKLRQDKFNLSWWGGSQGAWRRQK